MVDGSAFLVCVTTPLVSEARIRASGNEWTIPRRYGGGRARETAARRKVLRPGPYGDRGIPAFAYGAGSPPVLRRPRRPSSVGRVNFQSPIGWRRRTEQRPHRWAGSRTGAHDR
jgi:hypothetical protein